jgi:NAD(P)-dependent dehydrogenase (short-subunit alcohol dehydrogenase family)
MDLKGAVAVVTGGNGGLGQRICHALAKEGVHIAVIYAQSRDEAEAVARELTSRHQINAAAFACAVSDGAAVQRLIGDVTVRFGRLDVLVNDAAYNESIPFADLDNLTLEVWNKIMAVNLTGPMSLIKAVAPEGARAGPHRQRRVGSRTRANGLVHRVRGVKGGPHPPHALHGSGVGAGDTRQLCRTRTAGRHARDI